MCSLRQQIDEIDVVEIETHLKTGKIDVTKTGISDVSFNVTAI